MVAVHGMFSRGPVDHASFSAPSCRSVRLAHATASFVDQPNDQ